LVLVLEMAVAAIAVALVLVSLKTLQAIRHVGVGKSFWAPVAVSGFLFFFGSIVAILFELNYQLIMYTDEVVQISRLLALCILVAGIGSYSRKVTKNLGQQIRIPARAVETDAEAEAEAEEEPEAEVPATPLTPLPPLAPPATTEPPAPSIHERIAQESWKTETPQECRYKFGYLRTLPKDASIPDECLSCDKIIECKHARARPVETSPPESS
jgi:hypothetical protein